MADVQQPLPQQKPRKSWFGRNWWWVLILVVVGGAILCAGICSGVMFYSLSAIKKLEPYPMTVAAVRSDPTVVERLGEPIEDALWVNVQRNITNDRGNSLMNIPISGPKGAATVRSEAQMFGGKWSLTSVEVTFNNGERHVLVLSREQAGEGLEDAPPFVPHVPPGEVPSDAMPNTNP